MLWHTCEVRRSLSRWIYAFASVETSTCSRLCANDVTVIAWLILKRYSCRVEHVHRTHTHTPDSNHARNSFSATNLLSNWNNAIENRKICFECGAGIGRIVLALHIAQISGSPARFETCRIIENYRTSAQDTMLCEYCCSRKDCGVRTWHYCSGHTSKVQVFLWIWIATGYLLNAV